VIGIVIVAHSAKLAEGVKDLAEQMGQGKVPIAAAGGLDDTTIGTNMERILEAIETVYQPGGVLVLMDLGSAVMSTEMAIEMLSPDQQDKVLLSEAPLAEGTIAATVEASLGKSLAEVDAAARAVVRTPKVVGATPLAEAGAPEARMAEEAPPSNEMILTIVNKVGLHARPAALFVQTAGRFQSAITVRNLTRDSAAVDAKSMFGVLSIGAQLNHQIAIDAEGPDAEEALAAIGELVEGGFGEMEEAAIPAAVPIPRPEAKKAELKPAVLPAEDLGELSRAIGEMRELQGITASTGIAIGPAYVYRPEVLTVERRTVDDPQAEWARFAEAVEQAKAELGAIRAQAAAEVGEAEAEIFTAHQLFLEDPTLLERVRAQIEGDGYNAEAALAEAVAGYADLLRGMEGEVFRQRAADVEDVGRRVLRLLLGVSETTLAELPKPVVVVAHDLTPSDTAQLDKERALGFCTAIGGTTSHTAIMARSLGLPAVVGLGEDALSIPNEAPLIIDGKKGLVIAHPDENTLAEYRTRQKALLAQQVAARRAAQRPAQTLNGQRVEVVANVGDVASARIALEHGAEGVGLLRTEFLYLDRATMPGEEEQYAAYRAIADLMGNRPLIVRTFDIGGDKQLPYLDVGDELNPFLGWRAIRLCLDRVDLFQTQLRAILRASHERNIKIMFPMIADVGELRRAKNVLAEVRAELEAASVPIASGIEVGIMVEVPAAALAADVLAEEVDFFSIGTNDLIQYTLACDRTNEKVAYLYQPLHPAILRLIQRVIEAAHEAGKWVGMCGEMAGQPEAIPILLGLGLDEFSMSAVAIPQAKALIATLTLERAREVAADALAMSTADQVQSYAQKVMNSLADLPNS
jgi:phosphoenolpyruvate-protein phosphotransferase/dihydroxyacetone kinase phosphotransfer subunit